VQMYDVNTHEHPQDRDRERGLQRRMIKNGQVREVRLRRYDHVQAANVRRRNASRRWLF
jgi:hypothetical protein